MVQEMVSANSLSVIIPVYNSEQTIGPLVDQTVTLLKSQFKSLELVLVNDGSSDNSGREILAAQKRHPEIIRSISLLRNFGEHNAVMCGLNYAKGECIAIMDDDFQNPPSEIPRLVNTLCEGYDVVYGYYSRKRHSWFRNLGSSINDAFATWLLKKPAGLYLCSFKAMNRFLVNEVIKYKGPAPYLDALILRSTSKTGQCLCKHAERQKGKSSYTFSRLLRLWINMVSSSSLGQYLTCFFLTADTSPQYIVQETNGTR